MKKQVELSITHNGKDVVAYPYTKKEHVQFENGMNIDEFVGQDIATPTITHDTTAIKVGVGDGDVSSSVVDSTVNMTIKGQTYQNILPDPTLRNEMQGKSMQRLNEDYDSIETVDGVSKSAILKGQTLVNLTQPSLRAWTMNLNSDTASLKATPDEFIIDWSKGVPYNAWIQARNDNAPIFGGMIKPNTEYTFIINILENNPTFEGNKVTSDVARFQIWGLKTHQSESNYLRGGITGRVAFKYNFNRVTEGTIENVFGIAVSGTSANGTKTIDGGKLRISKDIIILEGDYTENYQDIPYFEGMQSVKMPVLTTVGKNLFDVNNVISGHITESAGFTPTDNNAKTIDWFYCKPNTSYTVSGGNRNRWILCNANGEETFIGGVEGNETPTITTLSDTVKFRCYVGYNAEPIDINNVQLEEGSVATTFESHKTNILHTPEEITLKGIGDVRDTLNCNTGEYVERIGVGIFDGSDDEEWNLLESNDNYTNFVTYKGLPNIKDNKDSICDKLPVQNGMSPEDGEYHAVASFGSYINILKSKASTVEDFKAWLANNNLTIQYELATPVVKTVDLSSHGNWEKVVLNGSENWRHESSFTHDNLIEFKLTIGNGNIASVISDRFATGGSDVERIACTAHGVYIRILKSKVNNLDEFKQWLQQNPTTVWYQTTTTQDNSIREMLSFANGHLQVSSEAENSLLPSVQYEIPTKNSYHMDLMKAGTWTIKSESCSGHMYIGDENLYFGLNSTNRTITLTQSQIDNLPNNLWYFVGTFKDGMVLEGDLTSKIIPYFKGIKSAFESEEEVEIVSTGKNLVNVDNYINYPNGTVAITKEGENSYIVESKKEGAWQNYIVDTFMLKANTTYTISYDYEILSSNVGLQSVYVCLRNHLQSSINVSGDCKNGVPKTFTAKEDVLVRVVVYATDVTPGTNKIRYSNIQVEESLATTEYEPYKTNITKIPLLSPLKSLPNGVCDEIILDRENNKAQIIQRVGSIVLDGSDSEEWHFAESNRPDTNTHYVVCANSKVFGERLGKLYSDVSHGVKAFFQDKFAEQDITVWRENGMEMFALHLQDPTHNRVIQVKILKNRLHSTTIEAFREWLSLNPITVQYELATPIITEVDLEGFPYIYKDGHIFLNSDIAPTTEITYSINQAQQIESANGNLQRHEKEITHLQKLIAQYIQVEYESTLLSLKI